jgi:exportin-7
VYNKAQRLMFDQSSPNGILLFREASKILVAYGSRIVQQPVRSDVYKEKYKGVAISLNVLTCALSGNYVNFGVFALYEDPVSLAHTHAHTLYQISRPPRALAPADGSCGPPIPPPPQALDQALEVALRLALNIPFQEILAFPKLSNAYFAFFEVLFRNHITAVLSLSTPVFLQVSQAWGHCSSAARGRIISSPVLFFLNPRHARRSYKRSTRGCSQSVSEVSSSPPCTRGHLTDTIVVFAHADSMLSGQCASTIDYLATYFFQNRHKDRPAMIALRQHLQAQPDMWYTLLSTLFSQLLFGNCNHWAITRPILSLMLASEEVSQSVGQTRVARQGNTTHCLDGHIHTLPPVAWCPAFQCVQGADDLDAVPGEPGAVAGGVLAAADGPAAEPRTQQPGAFRTEAHGV